MVTTDWGKVVEEKIATAKARGSKKRGWVKFTKNWLTSSINYRFTLEEKCIFSDLIVMADEYGSVPGLISDNDFRAMPLDYIAHLNFCSVELLESTLEKGKQDDSIFINGHGIFLTHFDDYQFTEYDRQRPYREEAKKKLNEEIKQQDTVSFEDFVESLVSDYPSLDIDGELKKFKLWWGESGRELKRPKAAFRNWLDKAMKIQQEREATGGTNRKNPRKVRAHDQFTTPEEYRKQAGW